jgi:phosphoesterase RecJ-like protein
VLPQVQLEDGVIWTSVSLEDMIRSGSGNQDISLSSFIVTAEEADISAVFTERQNDGEMPVVECSFRAKPGFDVSNVAFSFGGGGHPAASGCTVPGPMSDAIARVIPALKAARQESINQRSSSSGG